MRNSRNCRLTACGMRLTKQCSHEHCCPCRSLQGRFKTCSTSWKHQSRVDCGLGMFCNGSDWFCLNWETSRFRHRPTKTFDAEGEILEHPLTKSFRMRNDAIKGLCSSVRRFGKSTMNLQKFDGGWKIIASHTSIDDVIGLPRTTGPIPKHRPQ